MKTITSKSGKKITFRPPRKTDLEALYQYAKSLEAEDTFVLLNPSEPVNYQEEKNYLTSLLKDIQAKKKIHVLVVDNHKIAGASHIEKKGRRQGHVGLFGIALLQAYRSGGIGRQLADYVINLAKTQLQLTQIILDCLASNTIAIKFYKSLGFTQYGRQPKAMFYKNQYVDKILFYKHL